ncbi:MAG: sialate O-acetylesterase [Verrucomicrobia bacterium]|nr:sialate O-acetylesterase [Verrucomicrobiota bacterium]
MKFLRALVAALAALAFAGIAQAEVSLPAIFGNHMVLQRGIKVPVWGWAQFGERVIVKFGKQEKHAAVDKATGRWMVLLDPMEAGQTGELIVLGNGNSVKFTDVIVGDVWLASGQSNMAFESKSAQNWAEEAKRAELPQIRFFQVTRTLAAAPQQDCRGHWVVCDARTAAGFSAVAFFFGREIHETQKTPVGLIDTSWGATAAQLWMSAGAIHSLGPDDGYLARYRDEAQAAKMLDAVDSDFEGQLRARLRRAAEWSADQRHGDGRLDAPAAVEGWFPTYKRMTSGGYSAMIAPLAPFALKGVLWYQGESNDNWPEQYTNVMKTLIADWRRTWSQGDFPFLFVQLANFRETKTEPSDSGWARIREAQLQTLKAPNTGMAVAIDVGEAGQIHPKNKQAVAHRLALNARALIYGEKLEYSGPICESMNVEGSSIRLRFTHTTGGLKAKDGSELKGFAIAGEDQKFVWADAKVDGETIIVSSPRVAKPVAVRYAWAGNPICNLINGAGLPASPFRTDTWPLAQEK